MEKNYKLIKRAKIVVALTVAIILFSGVAFKGFNYFFIGKHKNFHIENDYFGFKIKTPRAWVGEENTLYVGENISAIIEDCKNQPLIREVGSFRFKDQPYPEDFEYGHFLAGNLSTGGVLSISVNCAPTDAEDGFYGNSALSVGGEETEEGFLNLLNFGKTKYLSFFHGGFFYKVTQLIYVSPEDAPREETIKNNYEETFSSILSDFSFVK